jgi:hypothetical protein
MAEIEIDTRHRELDWFDGDRRALQGVMADRVTVDSAVRLRGMKVVRLNCAKPLYAVFTEEGRQVDTVNISSFRTLSELDSFLEGLREEVQREEGESDE